MMTAYELPYSRKYWQELNLAVESKVAINVLARFKFGGSVQDRHMFICMEESFKFLIWRLEGRPPNRQI